jgi:hypothetical protein
MRRTSPGPPARRCSVTSHTAPRRKAAQVSPRPPSGPPKGTVPRNLAAASALITHGAGHRASVSLRNSRFAEHDC